MFVSDEPFRQWYSNKFPHRPPIPRGHVMRVKKALQGHPESARLWALLIDNVIRELNLQPCTHEPNLYFTNNYKGTGKRIFLMAPLHHHYQKLGYHESKIVTRFWIIGILLSVLTIVTLKIR